MVCAARLRDGFWRLLIVLLAFGFASAVHAEVGRKPAIAIIIDDLGNNWALSRRALDLPVAVTVSILPGTPHATRLARLAHEQGRQTMIHLPMESEAPQPLGPNAILASMDGRGIAEALQQAMASVPFAVGLNNHMGSRATADSALMLSLMQAVAQSPGMVFVDSRTSPSSIALEMARHFGVLSVRRDIFLDHEHEIDQVGHQFERLLQRARSRGSALAIGHPVEPTLDLLEGLQQRLEIEGIRLLSLHEFIALRTGRTPTAPQGIVAGEMLEGAAQR